MAEDMCDVKCIHSDTVRLASADLPSPQALEEAVVLFDSLSDPSRILILLGMRQGRELCVCDVAALLDVSVASASHHLRKMKDVGILRRRHEGKLVYYSINNPRAETLLQAAMAR